MLRAMLSLEDELQVVTLLRLVACTSVMTTFTGTAASFENGIHD